MTATTVIGPVPFEIVEQPDMRVASNGHLRVMLLEPAGDGRLFKRRGITGNFRAPTAESILPKLNQLAGELLKNPQTSAEEIQLGLLALAGLAQPAPPPVKHEWAVVELDGVRVYVAGNDVVVTRRNLTP